MIKRKVEIGAQIYINRDDTPEMIRKWVKQFQTSGLKVIRVFIFWYQVEPYEDTWNFTNYDALFWEAEKYGLSVCGTLMAVYPPGWMHITDNYKVVGDLDDDGFWKKALMYVEKVVNRYHRSPALNSWVVWKEPTRFISQNPNSMKAFQKYLKGVYGDINILNGIYYNSYASFDEVGDKKDSFAILNYKLYPESLDWIRFTVANLCDKLKDLSAAVRMIDPFHPVHVNAHNVGGNGLHGGQSIWGEAKTVDFLGCSNHPSWHALRFKQDRLHQSVAFFDDMIKSATPDPDGYFWVTELQGGPTTLSGGAYLVPSTDDITHWLWESVGTGASVVLFWVFNTRNSGDEGGEWSLLGQDGEPSSRLNAVSEAAKGISKHQGLFDGAKPKKPDIWLLCSENSWQMSALEGEGEDVANPRNRQYAPDALCAAYLMAADIGLQVQIAGEEKVINGELPADAVLIAPSIIAVEESLLPALERFVKNGGTLIADHMFALKDKNGYTLKPEKKAAVDRIFGAVFSDMIPDRTDFSMDAGEDRPDGWFVKLMFKEGLGGEVIGRFDDNSPAIFRNSYGKGSAIRIGTAFFQRYLSNPAQNNLEYLKSLLPDKIFAGIRLENPSAMLRLKELDNGEDRILIVLNSSKAVEARLYSDESGVLKPLAVGESLSICAGSTTTIKMAEGEVKLFVLSREA